MSRTMHFGRDILGAPDVDLEDLLHALAPSDIEALLNEMAADPDDKHVPASVRTSYRCDKKSTGPLNRDSLISHINEEGINYPDKTEIVKHVPGIKRGKIYSPVYNEEELKVLKEAQRVEEAVRLDDDEEAALAEASLNDLMTLAEIMDYNPQEFIMEAYADPLKYYEPDPPNNCNPAEELSKILENDKGTKEVCLNNIAGIEEKTFCELFDGLRNNNTLIKLSAVNCEINDFSIATLNLAIEKNYSLKSLNLESNRISPDTLASLFEAISSNSNGIIEIHVCNQAQSNMGYRVESRIADAIAKNNQLIKVGLKFQFPEVKNRVEKHLIDNIDKLRKERAKSGKSNGPYKRKPIKTLN